MKRTKLKRTEQGLTLLESLVGIMVIAIIITAITPAMLVAFATRAQNYRTEQAMKIAQGEIERVRLQIERGDYTTATLPPSLAQAGAGIFDLDANVKAPASNQSPPNCPLSDVTAGSDQLNRTCKVELGNGQWLAVQTFRSSTPGQVYDLAEKKPVAFIMGVRVYTKAAITATPSKLQEFPKRNTASGLTSGESLSLPLVTRYVPIVRSDLDGGISRRAYCELGNALSNQVSNCDI